MTGKIFRSIFIASVSVLLVTLLIITGCLSSYFNIIQQRELRDELEIAAKATEQLGLSYLNELKSKRYRLTWIDSEGKIIYDSDADISQMENHMDREEVREALLGGFGSSSRYSSTLTEKTLYEAVALKDGSVLRISIGQATSLVLVFGMIQPIIVIFLLAAVLSFILATRMAKNVVEPFNHLDLEHPMENDTYEELSPLLHRIYTLHKQIDSQIRELQWKKDEFEQIISQMQEGLILLDDKDTILSINAAAKKIFDIKSCYMGADFLTIDHSTELSDALKNAKASGHCEIRINRGKKEYQINISRTESKDHILGSVLLAFDITDQADSERMRQEFTANVSHELKTPLQSIMGSAELIENGLMKPEDAPKFARSIRRESSRLVDLIDDIIRLSQLDEGASMPFEQVELSDVAQEVFLILQDSAELKGISFSLVGGGAVWGVKRLIFEMLFNLCDNAVKYNKDNGSVNVSIQQEKDKTILSVSDTGIGIPEDMQSRVFERFFRVDKSHSKQSGGTGLGLSIVKHVVKYHNGSIQLESTEGKGTTITAVFPL